LLRRRKQCQGYKDLFTAGSKSAFVRHHPVTMPFPLQPNSGAQGEYSGLLAHPVANTIAAAMNQSARWYVLIPASAHGHQTPALRSGWRGMAGGRGACEFERQYVDLDDLKVHCERYAGTLAAIMVDVSVHPWRNSKREIRTLCEDGCTGAGAVRCTSMARISTRRWASRGPADYGADCFSI